MKIVQYDLLTKILYWLPRIFAGVLVVVLGVFVFDVFSTGNTLSETFISFFIHIFPSYVVLLTLIFTWKEEKIGGLLFVFLACIFTLFFKTYYDARSFAVISAPVFLIGILFLIHYYEAKKV